MPSLSREIYCQLYSLFLKNILKTEKQWMNISELEYCQLFYVVLLKTFLQRSIVYTTIL